MNIVIIGSGNVAAVLGRKFKTAGHEILQVVGRNAQAASALAYEWNSESANYMTLLNRDAELYVIAVSDDAIGELVADLRLPRALVVHTAAAVSRDVLRNVSPDYGVLYPLQSLRKEMDITAGIPLYIDGSNEGSIRKLKEFAASLTDSIVQPASDDQRLRLHLAAVLVSNFPNHLYALAEEYCNREGLNFEQLYPLIMETASRLNSRHAAALQTGPAVRGDQATINAHKELLRSYPRIRKVYETLSESISEFS